MKIPRVTIDQTDRLKQFDFFRAYRPKELNEQQVHPLDRLFVRDPIRSNARSTLRLTIPAMYADDRQAACEVMAAMALMYKLTDNHIAMLDYAHTVRLYAAMYEYVTAVEQAAYPEEEN
jgi:hypothetical protein